MHVCSILTCSLIVHMIILVEFDIRFFMMLNKLRNVYNLILFLLLVVVVLYGETSMWRMFCGGWGGGGVGGEQVS